MSLEISREDDTKTSIMKGIFHVMQTKDIPHITVDDVAHYAGIARSTFYRHFNSVDAAVKVFEDQLLELLADINEVALKVRFTQAQLEPTFSMIQRMETLFEYRDEVLLLTGPHGDPQFLHKATLFMYDYLRERVKTIPGIQEYQDLYLVFMVGGHHSFVKYWLSERSDISPKTAAAMLCRMYYAYFFVNTEGGNKLPCAPEFELE
ncbi:TetR/AcrR family transcriptional regulator [Collinsella sp. zg1085]|uniref:TetR/AcrR family transcriptional regulator n=1 Tax=Collinsella sp. zg1085 TaxID=2844380 RepID=UPI001C0C45B9|nr:TetR/AcrR family transcriptional regulator [Collinsella sp. zg1085]QWT17166.1 TetR/AcrR family transcriptional regulator [Collinsella sp. zg1085]